MIKLRSRFTSSNPAPLTGGHWPGRNEALRAFKGECAQFFAASLNASLWFKPGSSALSFGMLSRMNTLYELGSRGLRSRFWIFFLWPWNLKSPSPSTFSRLQKSCAACRKSVATWSLEGPASPLLSCVWDGGGAY